MYSLIRKFWATQDVKTMKNSDFSYFRPILGNLAPRGTPFLGEKSLILYTNQLLQFKTFTFNCHNCHMPSYN